MGQPEGEFLPDLWTLIPQLCLAFLAGGLVGWERERHYRSAGLRTHMLVAGGSALFTMVSLHLSPAQDQTRIAAQVVSGIGFLGAGTIFRAGPAIRGLTTAAGLWVVAAAGMGIAAGGQLMTLGLVAAALVFGINIWIRAFEQAVLRTYLEVTVTLGRQTDHLARLVEGLSARGVRITRMEWLADRMDGATAEEVVVLLRLRLGPGGTAGETVSWIGSQPGVRVAELS